MNPATALLAQAIPTLQTGGAGDGVWSAPVPRPSHAALVEGGSWDALWSLVAACVLLFALGGWLLARRRKDAPELRARGLFRPDLLVPVIIQSLLLLYWSLYYPALSDRLVLIVASLAFGLGLDLILRLMTRQEAVFHLGVLPLVLSVHLFVWFEEAHGGLLFVLIAVALLTKVFFQRDGRHVLNPSAAGIALVGTACYLAPETLRYVDIAHALNTPPNMFEAIVLLGLFAQLRSPIVLLSLSAALVQYLAIAVTGGESLIPSVHWAPVTLAVVLLATDPATIPRTGPGKVLFGAGYAVLMISLSLALEGQGVSDFFTKVIPIPILNVFTPALDRLGARSGERWVRWLDPVHNRIHVGMWLLFLCVPWWIIGGKANLFEGRFHPLYDTPHVQFHGPVAVCEENPVFCAPFSFLPELALWRGSGEGAQEPLPMVEEAP